MTGRPTLRSRRWAAFAEPFGASSIGTFALTGGTLAGKGTVTASTMVEYELNNFGGATPP